jgi:hypothetical protein
MTLDDHYSFLANQPRWLVIAVYTLAAALAIWILSKLLKIALWILLVVVVVGGAVLTLKHLFGR